MVINRDINYRDKIVMLIKVHWSSINVDKGLSFNNMNMWKGFHILNRPNRWNIIWLCSVSLIFSSCLRNLRYEMCTFFTWEVYNVIIVNCYLFSVAINNSSLYMTCAGKSYVSILSLPLRFYLSDDITGPLDKVEL